LSSESKEVTTEVTALLSAWGTGDQAAGKELMVIVYQELRRLAGHYLQTERSDHTLPATALVHELYLKLFSQKPVVWNDRAHFLAVAARQLRHIVVDYARSRHAQKRGGVHEKIQLQDACELPIPVDDRIIHLDDALQRLELLDARAAHVVELRFFGGLTDPEVGAELAISTTTVKRDWDFARSWLLKEMGS
jgi:RNA polymerase sigma factor (TIGR02999 family)